MIQVIINDPVLNFNNFTKTSTIKYGCGE